MPWKATDVMNRRQEFVLRVLREQEAFGDVCQEYGISRKTGYKWKKRFLEEGPEGLSDRSRRPNSHSKEIGEDLICRIIKTKKAHRSWGPRKIREVMARATPGLELPSESSFKRILDKAGFVTHRRRRKAHNQGRLTRPVQSERPNHVWTVDFKGWWQTANRSRCEPLTIRDDFSRFVLCAQCLPGTGAQPVREQFRRTFRRYGLPEVIRSDNGSPFASSGSPLGLSRLSAWWLTLGIDLDRIRPGKPYENGGHERMHRDMAMELESEAEEDLRTQQASLDVWRDTFNQQRPHEAIGMKVPNDVYQSSSRPYPGEVDLDYPTGFFVRKVSSSGYLSIRGMQVRISKVLQDYQVGLEPTAIDRFSVWFCRLCLGEIDLATQSFVVPPETKKIQKLSD